MARKIMAALKMRWIKEYLYRVIDRSNISTMLMYTVAYVSVFFFIFFNNKYSGYSLNNYYSTQGHSSIA